MVQLISFDPRYTFLVVKHAQEAIYIMSTFNLIAGHWMICWLFQTLRGERYNLSFMDSLTIQEEHTSFHRKNDQPYSERHYQHFSGHSVQN